MRTLLLLLLLLLPACADEASLAKEWAELRDVRGHFQGGTWNEDADSWKGRKFKVMTELGELLGKPGTTQAHLLEVMGDPDHTNTSLVEAPPGSQTFIYEWRGMHDFLYFVCSGGKVIKSGWWMAFE